MTCTNKTSEVLPNGNEDVRQAAGSCTEKTGNALPSPDAQVIVSGNVKMEQRVRVVSSYFKGFERNICEIPNRKYTLLYRANKPKNER